MTAASGRARRGASVTAANAIAEIAAACPLG